MSRILGHYLQEFQTIKDPDRCVISRAIKAEARIAFLSRQNEIVGVAGFHGIQCLW